MTLMTYANDRTFEMEAIERKSDEGMIGVASH
jgi:hypothetical protein